MLMGRRLLPDTFEVGPTLVERRKLRQPKRNGSSSMPARSAPLKGIVVLGWSQTAAPSTSFAVKTTPYLKPS
jgi:hypothetical protein